MPLTIPPVPAGIIDPNNLYNDVYGHEPPLAWADPEFQDRLAWIMEHAPEARITAWYALLNQAPNGDKLRVSTQFRLEVSEGNGLDVDVLSVMKLPASIAHMVRTLKGGAVPEVIAPYPGLIARNPPNGLIPVGEPWSGHPWKPRVLFHAVPETQYQVGDIFESTAGRYKKVRVQTKPGAGMFGTGGEFRLAWELVWQR